MTYISFKQKESSRKGEQTLDNTIAAMVASGGVNVNRATLLLPPPPKSLPPPGFLGL